MSKVTKAAANHSHQVVTYQSPRGSVIDICTLCEGVTPWPRDDSGEEYCAVSYGQHEGECDLSNETEYPTT